MQRQGKFFKSLIAKEYLFVLYEKESKDSFTICMLRFVHSTLSTKTTVYDSNTRFENYYEEVSKDSVPADFLVAIKSVESSLSKAR